MRKKLYCCTVTILFLLIGCRSSLQERVLSPDGRIEVVLNNPDGGNLSYSVNVEGESFIRDSRLGFVFKDSLISGPFRINKTEFSSKDEVWTQPWGENKKNRNHYNEMSVCLENEEDVPLVIRFRVFDDGIGFRYEYEHPDKDSLVVMDELTEFDSTKNQ